ncbi:hypothetical protein [Xanthomonas fragariae]|uniref:hypothetical protein n=1 Tax=Xanthomonas fragariae TaxID=48664 RepID=UPI001ABDB06E|nr:hypothetical protein [Xanthomonas fragariae]UKR53303.1 hypothetical protein K4A87_04765 [Xanthomonas fragariae]
MLTKFLKIVWILSSVAVLVITLTRYTPGAATDIGIFLTYGMMLLSFPVSLVVAGLFASLALLQEQLGVPLLDLIGSNYVGFSVLWLTFCIAGYLQWFVLFPWLWHKWKTK